LATPPAGTRLSLGKLGRATAVDNANYTTKTSLNSCARDSSTGKASLGDFYIGSVDNTLDGYPYVDEQTNEVYEINSSFTSPFIYVRTFRYIEDKKANNTIQDEKIKNIQQNGIWDCTLCGNCTQVCPSLIDIKSNIIYLRNKSAQFGYNDPNMYSDNISFGFDPNGF